MYKVISQGLCMLYDATLIKELTEYSRILNLNIPLLYLLQMMPVLLIKIHKMHFMLLVQFDSDSWKRINVTP
jgi:hypothetical protein